MEYYLAIKRNKVLMHASTWMNLENIMLRERSQTQKGHVLWDSKGRMAVCVCVRARVHLRVHVCVRERERRPLTGVMKIFWN